LVSVPVKMMLALADTIVVIYTEPPLPPAVSSVYTTKVIVYTGPIVSTQIVTQTEGQPSTENLWASSSREARIPGESSSNGISGGSGENGLSKLEIVGTVIGIVLGLITTVATVWICVRGGRN
jgi:hypothetical protein